MSRAWFVGIVYWMLRWIRSRRRGVHPVSAEQYRTYWPRMPNLGLEWKYMFRMLKSLVFWWRGNLPTSWWSLQGEQPQRRMYLMLSWLRIERWNMRIGSKGLLCEEIIRLMYFVLWRISAIDRKMCASKPIVQEEWWEGQLPIMFQ